MRDEPLAGLGRSDRRGRLLALQPRRELRARCDASRRRRLHGALTVLAAETFTGYGRVG